MIDHTIYTFTAAGLAKRDVDNQRIGWTKHRMVMMERGHLAKEAYGVELFDRDGAAAAIPYPQPTRSRREESESMLSSWRFRFRNDHIEGCTSSIGWRVASRFDVWGARITLWHDLMLHPWKCDGCDAPLASETEEHQCP